MDTHQIPPPPPSTPLQGLASYTPSFTTTGHTLTTSTLLRAVDQNPQAVVNYILSLEARVRQLEKRVVIHHTTLQGAKALYEKMARQLEGSVKNQERAYEKSFREMGGLERAGVFEEEEGEMGQEEEEHWDVDYAYGYGGVLQEYEGDEVEDKEEGLADYVSENGEGGFEGYGGEDDGAFVDGMEREEVEGGDNGQDYAGEDVEMDVDEEEEEAEEYTDTPPSPPPSPSLIRG